MHRCIPIQLRPCGLNQLIEFRPMCLKVLKIRYKISDFYKNECHLFYFTYLFRNRDLKDNLGSTIKYNKQTLRLQKATQAISD